MLACHDLPARSIQQNDRVGQRWSGAIPGRFHRADQDLDWDRLGLQCLGEAIEDHSLAFDPFRFQQQITGWVAPQRQLGCQQQISAKPMGLTRRINNAFTVAGQVSDEAVELSESQTHQQTVLERP